MGTFKVLELTPIISVFWCGAGASKWKKYVRLPQKHVLKNDWQLLVYEKFRFGYGVEGGGEVISLGTPCIVFHLYEPIVHTSGWTSQYSLPTLSFPTLLFSFLPSYSLPSYSSFLLCPFLPYSFLLSTFQVSSLFLQSSVSQTNLDILNI